MAYGYIEKDEATLAWLDNRDQVKLDIRKIARRVENAVMAELDKQYKSALNEGRLLEIRPGEESLRQLVAKHARELTS